MFEQILTTAIAAFIPIFVAMDAIGVLPIYIGLIETLDKPQRKKVLIEASLTAGILGTLFIFFGKGIFKFLGITVADFMVAGGIVLLILSITDLIFPEKSRQRPAGSVGVVPLGMPLIVGPATLTTLIFQSDLVGTPVTLVAFVVNLLLAMTVFFSAGPIMAFLGKGGTQAVSKMANLLLAAIATMIIRKGIVEIVTQFSRTPCS